MTEKLEKKSYSYGTTVIAYYVSDVIVGHEKETLVMLHAAFADHRIFTPQVEALSQTYQVICVDLVGHGGSQPSKLGVSMKDMPKVVTGILDQENVTTAHMIGVSLGSLVAQCIAHRYPDRVRSVTVVGGYSIHKDYEYVLKEQKKEMFRWLWRIVFSMKSFRTYVIQASISTEYGKRLMEPGVNLFTRRSFPAMQGMDSCFTPIAAPMPYPLLIIYGEHDLPLVKQVAQKWVQLEPGSQLVEIKNAGHCANADNGSAFNRALEGFLESSKEQAKNSEHTC